eukprot:s8951_g2.t1
MAGGSPCDEQCELLQTLILRLDPAHKRVYMLCARSGKRTSFSASRTSCKGRMMDTLERHGPGHGERKMQKSEFDARKNQTLRFQTLLLSDSFEVTTRGPKLLHGGEPRSVANVDATPYATATAHPRASRGRAIASKFLQNQIQPMALKAQHTISKLPKKLIRGRDLLPELWGHDCGGDWSDH